MNKFTISRDRITLILIFLIGTSLATFQFFYNRSLWVDEAMIALGIINKSPYELLFPLAYQQVAPILFVQIERIFSGLFHNTEFGLRIFPLLSFIGSLPLMYKITLIITNNKVTSYLSLLLFTLTPKLLYYSSEVKQYMSDVFTCLLLIYVTIYDYKTDRNKLICLTLTGIISIFLSNISVVILTTLGLFLIFDNWKNIKELIKLCIPFASWTLTFLFYYYTFIKGHPSKEYMLIYWADTFMPLNIYNKQFWLWQKAAIHTIFDYLLGFWYFSKLVVFLYFVGVIKLIISKKYTFLIILLTPTVLHLTMSALKLYPFAIRLILYLTPLFIIGISIGFELIAAVITKRIKARVVYRVAFFFLPSVLVFELYKVYPFKFSEIKDSLYYLSKNRNPSERIYIPFLTVPQFRYYTSINYANLDQNVIYGIWNKGRGTAQGDIKELDKLDSKGWVLFSLHNPGEQESIINTLKTKGSFEKKFETRGSEVYMFIPKQLGHLTP